MKNIKVAYNYNLASGVGGCAEYLRGLLSSLCSIDNEGYNFFLFYNSFRGNFPILPQKIKDKSSLIKTRLPLPGSLNLSLNFRYRMLYPYLCKSNKINIFHSALMPSVINQNILSISTVYDVFWNLRPDLTINSYYAYMRNTFKYLNKYTSIITVSNNTKEDLIKSGVKPEKITVIYLGLNDVFLTFCKISEEEKEKKTLLIKNKYSLPEKYFLYVGNFVCRKNTPWLIDIFYKYKKLQKTDIKLVLVGSFYGNDYSIVQNKIKKMGIGKDVLFVGCVEEGELPYIYSNAEILLFLSLYEGFGLPPLEAMAVGIPTIVADNSSLTELTKGYSFLVDPKDDQQIISAIDKILNDKVYAKTMIDNAKKYVSKFNWHNTARETLDLYKKIVG